MDHKISVFAINLASRKDRKASLISEFAGKEEFQLTIVPAMRHRIGAFGLWQSICRIVRQADDEQLDFVLICEDDHGFTERFTPQKLNAAVEQTMKFDADVLLGGVSWFDTTLQIDDNLFWLDHFNGAQFTVIFQKFYQKILGADFQLGDDADIKISSLTDSIFVMYPFISVQKEFGYSDVTKKNGAEGRVTGLFRSQSEKLAQLDTVADFYRLFE